MCIVYVYIFVLCIHYKCSELQLCAQWQSYNLNIRKYVVLLAEDFITVKFHTAQLAQRS